MTKVKHWSHLPLVLNCEQTAEVLGMNRQATGRLLRSGIIKGVKTGKNWLVSRDGLRRFIETGRWDDEIPQ